MKRRYIDMLFRFGQSLRGGTVWELRDRKMLLGLFLVLCSGCVINKPVLSETTTTRQTNGVVVMVERRLSVLTMAGWPGTSSVDHQKAMIGKWLTVNSEGLEQSSGSTNIADTIRALTELVGRLKP